MGWYVKDTMSSLRRSSAAISLAALLIGSLAEASAASPARAAETPPPANSSPMAELKKSNAQLDKVMQKNKPNWSPEACGRKLDFRYSASGLYGIDQT